MKEHFVRLKVGMLEHVEDGAVTPAMLSVYAIILWQADYETGFWKGSAPKLQAAWCGNLSLRTIQRALEALCDQGYLRSFHTPGQRHNYLVAINKYLIKSGKYMGYWLNASATTVPERPVYELADGETTIDLSDPASTYVGHCDTTATSTAPNEGGVLARILDTREIERRNNNNPVDAADDVIARTGEPTAKSTAKATALTGKATAKPAAKARTKGAALLSALRESYDVNGPLNLTNAHKDAALEMAEECGQELFLAAFDLWVRSEPSETFLVTLNGGARAGDKEPIRWPLHKFINEGYALKYIDLARPYQGIASGAVLRLLCNLREEMWDEESLGAITREQAERLSELIDSYGYPHVFAAILGTCGDMDDFLENPAHHIQRERCRELIQDSGRRFSYPDQEQAVEAIMRLIVEVGERAATETIKRRRWQTLFDLEKICESQTAAMAAA